MAKGWVIAATFYQQDENSDMVADAEPVTETLADTPIPNVSAGDNKKVTSNSENNAATDDTIAAMPPTTDEVQTDDSNTAAMANNAVKADPAADQANTMQQPNHIADINTGATSNRTRTTATYTPDQASPYADRSVKHQSYQQTRKAAIARSQEQTKKHHEMMQQRRQPYEKEMQERRQQYEAMMKAQQEKRAKIAEMQKAVFQRIQQDRLASNQRIQEMHENISKMHEEIHQMMHDSQPHYRNNSAPQMLQPADEKTHSI